MADDRASSERPCRIPPTHVGLCRFTAMQQPMRVLDDNIEPTQVSEMIRSKDQDK